LNKAVLNDSLRYFLDLEEEKLQSQHHKLRRVIENFENQSTRYLGDGASKLKVCTWRQNSDERSVNPLASLTPPDEKGEATFNSKV
jgi:hypothetical protein